MGNALKSVNAAIKQTQTELRGLTTLLKFDPKNSELITQKQRLLSAAVVDTKDKLDALRATQQKINDGSIEATEEEYRDLEREIASTEAKLRNLSVQHQQFASVSAVQLQAVGKEFKNMGQKMTDAGKALLPLTIAIAAVGAAALKASINFESSFAGVRKTVNATQKEFDALAESARQAALVKPVDVNDINHIMELGGQLNIAKENLAAFASVIGDLDVSTDMNLEDASLQLSQFMNICGTAQTDIDRLGATLVGLGNNSATTESAIMEMAMRIAGSGTQIGLTEAQIMGLSASLASVGIEAQMGGSAISRTMSEIDVAVAKNGDDLAAWASAAGMSAQDFKTAWETDAAGALATLLAGMQDAVESGGNINLILDELGITELRQSDTLKRLTSAAQLMTSTMDIANVSWEENTALTNEASQRYATTESRLLMLKNQVVDVGISIGNGLRSALIAAMEALQPLLVGISAAARAFEDADPAIQTLIVSAVGLVASIAPLLIVTGKITSSLGSLMIVLGKSAAAFAAKSAAAAGDTAATIANEAATKKNIITTNAQIIRDAIKEATDVRLAAKTAAKTAATVADTAATNVNTTATTANATAATGATIKTIALSVAAKAKAVAAGIATVAQLAWNAAMSANPIGAIVVAVSALVGAIGVLAVAITSNIDKQEQLTDSSMRQKEKVDELQTAYDEAVASQGEHSDAAVEAKYALDQETASFQASKLTMDEFLDKCSETIASHDELAKSIQDTGAKADIQAGKMLYLAEQVESLSGIEGKSTTEKAQLAAITDELNASCEGLNVTYDAQNDQLNMSIEAIKEAARAEADRVRAQAAMQSYSDLLGEQVQLETQLADAQANLDVETKNNVDSWGKLGDVQVYTSQTQLDLEQNVKDTQQALDENAASQQRALEISAKYSTKQSALARAVQEVNDGTLSAEEAAAKYADAVEGGITADEIRAQQAHEAALAEQEMAQALSEAEMAVQSYADAHPSFQEALRLSGLSVTDFAGMLAAQDMEFEDAAKAIEEYSARAASGFSKVADSSKNTLDVLYETLAYNLQATENWGANLEAVFGRTGISFSEEFVNAVKSGGVEEYGTVMAQLAQLSDEELQAISDSYARNGQTGVENYLEEQRLLVPGTKEALDGTGAAVSEALSSGETAAGQSGTNTGTAYSENLKTAIAACPEEVQVYIQQLETELESTKGSAAKSGEETGSSYSESLKAGIASCPVEIQTYISQLEGQLQAFQQQAGALGNDTGAAYGANTATSMSAQTGAVGMSAASLRMSAQGELSQLPGYGSIKGAETGTGLSNGLFGQSLSVYNAAFGLKTSAEGPLSTVNGLGYGTAAGSGFGVGIGETYEAVNANASTIAACCQQWSAFGSLAWGWGSDAGGGFANGLRSAISVVRSAASAVASSIASILHFSVPDEGPLSDAEEYGPDFVQLIAEGMLSGISTVRQAAAQVAKAAHDELSEAFAQSVEWNAVDVKSISTIPRIFQPTAKTTNIVGARAGGTIQNNFYGNITLRADDVKDIDTFNDFAQRLQQELRCNQ